MTRIWVSDVRGQLLERSQTENNSTSIVANKFIVNDDLDINWFTNNLDRIINSTNDQKVDIIFMFGLNDCIASCTWNELSITSIALEYAAKVKSYSTSFSNITFYMCSVPFVEKDCPCADFTGSMLSKESLNSAIDTFNSTLKDNLSACYVDCCKYLASFDQITYDGVRYNEHTCASILSYITYLLSDSAFGDVPVGGISNFKPRYTAPYTEDSGDDCLKYWRRTDYGGLNPFPLPSVYARIEGDTLPNCTAWAWGRFYEIIGEKPKLSLNNAEYWFLKDGKHGYGNDGYSRGMTPVPGAIICWQKDVIGSPGAGHVAIVEEVYDDGSILISESGWKREAYWWTSIRYPGPLGNWGQSSAYTFQGFIYPPKVQQPVQPVTKDMIRLENSREAHFDSENQKISARYIWQYFSMRGWTMNAVAAMLGNMEVESGINPATWQSWTTYGNPNLRPGGVVDVTYINYDEVAKLKDALGSVGYGLVQWTPYTWYIDWCENKERSEGKFWDNGTGKVLPFWDIDSQLYRIECEVDNKPYKQWALYYKNSGYEYKGESFDEIGKSFKNFITSEKDPDWLAAAFAFCYERPRATDPDKQTETENRDLLCTQRGKRGTKWYNYLRSLYGTDTGSNSIAKQKSYLSDFRVCSITSTSATCSFIGYGQSAEYYINDSNSANTVMLQGNHTSFIINNLTPDSAYSIKLIVSDGDGNKLTAGIEFKTLIDRPKSVNNIVLTKKANFDNFELKLDALNLADWGYWRNLDYGYILQLIVDGHIVEEKILKSINSNFTFNLSNYFGYQAKLGDNIQIGIRTWVSDGKQKIYDDCFAKTSNAIYCTSRAITAFIN